MKSFFIFLLLLLLCLAIGWTGSAFQTTGLSEWYPGLVKSRLTPPSWVFPMVWTILYILMSLSIFLVVIDKEHSRQIAIGLFAVQLILNLAWSLLFFKFRLPAVAFAELLVLDVVVACYMVKALRIHPIAGWVILPYLLWLGLATYLNGFIAWHN